MSNRGLASSSAAVLAGMILRQLGIIGSFSILSRTLEQSDYGLFRQVWMVGLALTSITALGLPQSMQYFIPQTRAQSLRRWAFLQSLVLIQIGGCLAGLIICFLARPISCIFVGDYGLAPLLRAYWPVVLFVGFWVRANQIFNSIERPRLAGMMTGLYGALLVASLGGAVLFTKRLEHLFLFQAAAMLVAMVPAVIIGWCLIKDAPQAGGQLPGAECLERRLSVGRQLRYSLPLTATFLVEAVNRLIDKALVSNRFDSTEFAVYANGAIEIPIGVILVASVFSTMLPRLTRAYAAKDTEQTVKLNHLAVRNIAMIVFPSAIFLAMFSMNLMVVLFGQRYAASGWVFMIYATGMLAVLYSPYSLIISTGKTRLTFYLSLAAAVTNFAMSWLGITLLGMVGAAIGSISYRFLINILYARIAAGALGTSFRELLPWRHLGKTLLICAVAGIPACGILLAPLPPLARLVTGAAAYGVAYVLIGLKVGLIERAHIQLVQGWLGKLRGR